MSGNMTEDVGALWIESDFDMNPFWMIYAGTYPRPLFFVKVIPACLRQLKSQH